MNKSVIIAACALILPAIQIPAQTIRSSYLGVLLLQNNDVVDLFGIDSDPSSVFHSGGLRSLNKAQVEGLLSRLRADVIKTHEGGGTKLYDGAALAI